MKNQKGISLIKVILITVVIIVVALWIISKISQNIEKKEKEAREYQEAQLAATRYESSYNIGDTITTSKYEITVKNIEERTKIGIPKHYKTVDDYYYTLVCATINIKNISSEPQRIYDYRPDFSLYFKLEDEYQYTYSNDSDYTTYYQYEFDNYNYSQLTIKPGETVTVNPVFKMDKSKYQNRAFYLKVLGDTALVKIK